MLNVSQTSESMHATRLPLPGLGEVHVWRAWLDESLPCDQMERLLSADELRRAASLRFDVHRARFVRRRGFLRTLLGRYLDIEASEITFEYSPWGKPALIAPCGGDAISFSASSAEDLAVVAVSRPGRIGVDVARLTANVDHMQIAKAFFSQGEAAWLGGLPPKMQRPAFFAMWTAKEAYVKAVGQGLSMVLDKFEVRLDESDATFPGHIHTLHERPQWALGRLDAMPGLQAAVVVEGARCLPICLGCSVREEV